MLIKSPLTLLFLALAVLCGCNKSNAPQGGSSTPEMSSIATPDPYISQLHKDLVPIQVGGKWGYIDSKGIIKITPQYDKAYDFDNGLAEVCIGECTYDKPGKHGLLGINGVFVANPIYDDIGSLAGALIPVCLGKCQYNGEDSKWGYIDRTGKTIIVPQFGKVLPFSNGLAAVCIGSKCGAFVDRNGKWGFIDVTGQFKINPQFDDAGYMANGLAKVEIGEGKDAKVGYIDPTGKYVYNPTN